MCSQQNTDLSHLAGKTVLATDDTTTNGTFSKNIKFSKSGYKYCYLTLIIQYYSFVCTLLNSSKYCYISLTIQLKHKSSICTQLNDQTVQFSISHLFAFNLHVK